MTTERLKELLAKARDHVGKPGWHFDDSHFFDWLAENVHTDSVAFLKEAVNSLPALVARIEEVEAALRPFAEAQYAWRRDIGTVLTADLDPEDIERANALLTPNQRGDNG